MAKVKKDKVEHNKGYKIRSKGKDHTGHLLEVTAEYVIIHDAVTREHKKIKFVDIDGDGELDEVEATWLA